jgi:hypothetical protein
MTVMHATIEEILEAVFSVESLPRCYKGDESGVQLNLKTAARRVGN